MLIFYKIKLVLFNSIDSYVAIKKKIGRVDRFILFLNITHSIIKSIRSKIYFLFLFCRSSRSIRFRSLVTKPSSETVNRRWIHQLASLRTLTWLSRHAYKTQQLSSTSFPSRSSRSPLSSHFFLISSHSSPRFPAVLIYI